MSIEETKQKIHAENIDFVLSEYGKIKALYKLKKEIRYNLIRETEFETESVAEHIYAMHCLCDYFLPLDLRLADADISKIRTMITYHDIDEIKTGDTVCYENGEAEKYEDASALEVINGLPEHMIPKLRETITEYHAQTTIESKFVKALDKVEPGFQCYSPEMKKVLKVNNVSLKMGMAGNKKEIMEEFPVIIHFHNVIANQMKKEGFFADSE